MKYTIENPKLVKYHFNTEEDNFTGAVKDENCNIAFYKNDKLHREDGPALIGANGYNAWYINDKRHREGGPAVIFPSGTKEWWIHGKRHREDGPAIYFSTTRQTWYYNDEIYGYDNDFTVETWVKKWKLEIFK